MSKQGELKRLQIGYEYKIAPSFIGLIKQIFSIVRGANSKTAVSFREIFALAARAKRRTNAERN